VTHRELHEVIRAELLACAEPWKLPTMQRFFKDPIDAYCAYTPHVRAIAKHYGAEFGAWPEQERTALARLLWASGKFEEGSVAILLFARMRRRCEYCHWKLFTRWLERDVRNWAHCDTLCAELLGPLLIRHPEWVAELREWAGAKQKFKRRAALVAPLKGLRKGLFRAEAREFMDRLAGDPEEIVRKGVVWVRRELAR
jgi:3-methyladenine DNA glycosylase AlkD